MKRWMVGLIVALLLVLGWLVSADNKAKMACLRAGYPEYQRVMFDRYCGKRVNQTDVVVPLSEVQ